MNILHWVGKIFNKGLKEKDKKEGLLKRLKIIETNQNSNNNDESKLSSARSESSKKTSISDDASNDLELKNETQTSFEYLKNNIEEFFNSFPNIFNLDLKKNFNYIASEEKKKIDYEVLSRQILLPSKNIFSFFDE